MIPKSIQKNVNLTTILSCFFVFFVCFGAPAVSADNGDFTPIEGDLFTDALYSEAAPYLGGDDNAPQSRVKRSRFVRIDFDRLSGKGPQGKRPAVPVRLIRFNLFHDVNFTARVDRVTGNGSGSTTWIGKPVGDNNGSVIFTVREKIMVGSFTTDNRTFRIRYLGGDLHEIQETDHSKFSECNEPLTSNPVDLSGIANMGPVRALDAGATIDVMVVYTQEARAGAGGTAAMQTLIDQAMVETNSGYGNSTVNPRLNLVRTEEIVYNEAGFDWATCLNRLKTNGDGFIDNVHASRNSFCADVVVMIVNNSSYCGMATTIMADASSAFCLVSRVCTVGYYSFAHEIGHLQGARHDRAVDNIDGAPYDYNHGYAYPDDKWRTIMAYNTACTDVGVSCTRVNYWSNPNVLYMGTPTGVFGGAGVGADNHKCLNNTAWTVANFRNSLTCCYGSYCASMGTSQAWEWIAGVKVGEINNSSGASGYKDFTDIATHFYRFSEVGVALTPGFAGGAFNEFWEIYIDYNHDSDFTDPGEKVFSGSGNGIVTGTFIVPTAATVGCTRMRVVMQYNAFRNNACGNFDFGEVEDYRVSIL